MKKIVYEADCIEHGKHFYMLFKTTETNPLKLRIMGKDMASEWGAECIEVTKVEKIDGKYHGKAIEDVWDYDDIRFDTYLNDVQTFDRTRFLINLKKRGQKNETTN